MGNAQGRQPNHLIGPNGQRIRRRRPRRRYTVDEKRRAVLLLDRGYSCRRVARIIGYPCSPMNAIRWRRQFNGIHPRGRNFMPGHAALNRFH